MGTFRLGASCRRRSGYVLRGGPDADVVALPLHHLAVRFQAAVRDHGNAVLALVNRFGVLECLVRIAHHLLACSFGARAGLLQVVFLHHVRQYFVFHLDFADGVVGRLLGDGRHGGHLHALPLDLGPGRRHDVHGFHAGGLFGRAGIDGGDARMGVGAAHVGGEKHALGLEVGGVLGAPAGLLRAVQALRGLADDLACLHRRPGVVGSVSHFSLLSCGWRRPLRAPPGGRPCRFRSGTGCRPARA